MLEQVRQREQAGPHAFQDRDSRLAQLCSKLGVDDAADVAEHGNRLVGPGGGVQHRWA